MMLLKDTARIYVFPDPGLRRSVCQADTVISEFMINDNVVQCEYLRRDKLVKKRGMLS